jgi:hypothetical protein
LIQHGFGVRAREVPILGGFIGNLFSESCFLGGSL